jgi:hypothetical protein
MTAPFLSHHLQIPPMIKSRRVTRLHPEYRTRRWIGVACCHRLTIRSVSSDALTCYYPLAQTLYISIGRTPPSDDTSDPTDRHPVTSLRQSWKTTTAQKQSSTLDQESANLSTNSAETSQTASTDDTEKESTGDVGQDPTTGGTSLSSADQEPTRISSSSSQHSERTPPDPSRDDGKRIDGLESAPEDLQPKLGVSSESTKRDSALTGPELNNTATLKRQVPQPPSEKKDAKASASGRNCPGAASLLPRPHPPPPNPAPASPRRSKVRTTPKAEAGRLGPASTSATPQTLARKNVATFGDKGVVENKGGAAGPGRASQVRVPSNSSTSVQHTPVTVPPNVETRIHLDKNHPRHAEAGKRRKEVQRGSKGGGAAVILNAEEEKGQLDLKTANLVPSSRGPISRIKSPSLSCPTSKVALAPKHPTTSPQHATPAEWSAKSAVVDRPPGLLTSANSKDAKSTVSSDRALSTSNSKGSSPRPPRTSLFAPTASSLAKAQKRDVTKPVKS